MNGAVCISLTVPQVRAHAFRIDLEDLDEELVFVLYAVAVTHTHRGFFVLPCEPVSSRLVSVFCTRS